MKQSLSRLISVACALVALLVSAAAGAHGVEKEQVAFPVVLSDGQTYSLVGQLYRRPHLRQRTIQVLVHGATYDHRYWDAPDKGGHEYSYARYMVEKGYDVLAIDQLGTGASDHPDGDFFTLTEAASGLHQVLDSLRHKHNPAHRRFDDIVLVGHSLGSITAVAAQAAYGDADALVVTGLALTPHPPPVDPAVLGALLGSPYVTFPSSLRALLFFAPGEASQQVVTYDNAFLATCVPRGHFVSAFEAMADPASLASELIAEPVLVQLGENDVTAPGSLASGEAAFYPNASSVTVDVLPDVGHAFNLHLDNKRGWRHIHHWIEDELCSD
jgi:pimeloyl-ACP methyl ester carboxylesterase